MKGYITKRPNGLFLVTKFKPVITEIKFTNKLDAYIVYGDPVGFLNVSQDFVDTVYNNIDIKEPLIPHRMCLYGDKQNTTHYAAILNNGLYTIYTYSNIFITNVCPWFMETMFGVKDLHYGQPTRIHFSGELYGHR